MANIDAPRGFTCISDKQPSMRCQFAATDASAAGIGDIVKLTGTSDATGKYPIVAIISAAADVPCGVLKSIIVENSGHDQSKIYREASVKTDVIITPIYEGTVWVGQSNGVVAAADIGLCCDPTFTTLNTSTGMSTMEIDISTKATTLSFAMKILRISQEPDNALGANANLEFKFNESSFYSLTAGV